MSGRSIFNAPQASVFCLSVQERFERQWRRRRNPNLPDFWKQMGTGQPTLSTAGRQELLWRLVEIDLDYRWSSPHTGITEGSTSTTPKIEPWVLEEYLLHLPELGPNERIPVEVIAHEYRLWRVNGRYAGSTEEYLSRFPNHGPELKTALNQVEAALILGRRESHRKDGGASIFKSAAAKGLVRPFRTINGYELLGELGRGGMGIAYLARQIRLDRLVVLKAIRGGSPADGEEKAHLKREAKSLAKLNHPNIVQVYDVFQHEDENLLVMEYVEGGTLERRIRRGPLSAWYGMMVIEILARAVHVAHGCGIIHRDLKPANVFLTTDGTPKIGDFGLAKLISGQTLQTQEGMILGTLNYMAPEQAAGQTSDIGPGADIYALGAILFELITGTPPPMAMACPDKGDKGSNTSHRYLPAIFNQPCRFRSMLCACAVWSTYQTAVSQLRWRSPKNFDSP